MNGMEGHWLWHCLTSLIWWSWQSWQPESPLKRDIQDHPQTPHFQWQHQDCSVENRELNFWPWASITQVDNLHVQWIQFQLATSVIQSQPVMSSPDFLEQNSVGHPLTDRAKGWILLGGFWFKMYLFHCSVSRGCRQVLCVRQVFYFSILLFKTKNWGWK